jgi:adenylate cyclase
VAQREYVQRVSNYRDQLVVKLQKTLEEQENQVYELLKRLLPESVALALKEKKNAVIAENFEEISILFTDMKGFTAYSSTVTPVELMRFLDRMFSTFDKIAGEISKKYIIYIFN